MGYKNPKNIVEDFGHFDKKLKVAPTQMPYKKMSKGKNNKAKYIQPDWIVKSIKYFEFDSLMAKFNVKLASKRRFKNSLFQHPNRENE